jgi:hypothetical protein
MLSQKKRRERAAEVSKALLDFHTQHTRYGTERGGIMWGVQRLAVLLLVFAVHLPHSLGGALPLWAKAKAWRGNKGKSAEQGSEEAPIIDSGSVKRAYWMALLDESRDYGLQRLRRRMAFVTLTGIRITGLSFLSLSLALLWKHALPHPSEEPAVFASDLEMLEGRQAPILLEQGGDEELVEEGLLDMAEAMPIAGKWQLIRRDLMRAGLLLLSMVTAVVAGEVILLPAMERKVNADDVLFFDREFLPGREGVDVVNVGSVYGGHPGMPGKAFDPADVEVAREGTWPS